MTIRVKHKNQNVKYERKIIILKIQIAKDSLLFRQTRIVVKFYDFEL